MYYVRITPTKENVTWYVILELLKVVQPLTVDRSGEIFICRCHSGRDFKESINVNYKFSLTLFVIWKLIFLYLVSCLRNFYFCQGEPFAHWFGYKLKAFSSTFFCIPYSSKNCCECQQFMLLTVGMEFFNGTDMPKGTPQNSLTTNGIVSTEINTPFNNWPHGMLQLD